MSNAPVFYFLIQVRFNRVTQMYQHVPALQEALRRQGFADFNEETQFEIAFQQTSESHPGIQESQKKRWLFNDMEKSAGFVLLEDALVYHTTAYSSFGDAKAAILRVLELLHQSLGLNFVQRVGVRYLDCVAADQPGDFAQMLHPGLLGLHGELPGRIRHGYFETVSSLEGLTLVLKNFMSPDSLTLPPDLQGLALTLPEALMRPGRPRVVMDSDCFTERRFAFDIDGIESQLDTLHGHLLDLFKLATTESARQEWQL